MNLQNKQILSFAFIFFFNLVSSHTALCKTKKIIGMMPVKNEALIVEQALYALSLYTDAIVVLDDGSEDNTLEIVKSLTHKCNIEKIIAKKGSWKRELSADQNRMLHAGRKLGGTHFIYLDADEMLTANCAKDNFLRNEILKLQPGDQLILPLIELWHSTKTYRADDGIIIKTFIFCDDGVSDYDPKFMHSFRSPNNLSGEKKLIKTHCVMHFQGVNKKNMQIRQAWYRCLERVRMPNKSIVKINQCYNQLTDEKNLKLKPVHANWFDGYNFFDSTPYYSTKTWRKKMLYSWFDQYGRDYFAGINMMLDE